MFENITNQYPIYSKKDLFKLYKKEFPDMTNDEFHSAVN
jgi:hypothetical protein